MTEAYVGPIVPISFGELADKITILQIKSERLSQPTQLANVHRELTLLSQEWDRFAIDASAVRQMVADLRQVNESLWDVEEALRRCEAQEIFDEDFINLARKVYFYNDRRAEIKRVINQNLGSVLIEEKSY